METKTIIKQNLIQKAEDKFDLAEKYYLILSAINNLGLTEREIQLIAFTAIKGNITYANVRDEFCKKFSTTSPTINNIISKLKKRKIFVKNKKIVSVNPVIVLDFNKDLTLVISLQHETK